MPRGGARPGAGGKPTWKNGKTKTIRVPVALADAILAFARDLDEHGIIEPVTTSKVVNLSGISIRQNNGAIAIHLEDLAKAGYEIQPKSLSDLANARLQKLSIDKQLKDGNNTQRGERSRVLHS
jgi:type II secretory pathway component PulJ